jgi:hypothetical protein
MNMLVVIALIFIASTSNAQTRDSGIYSVANEALLTLKDLVNDQNAKQLGFESARQVVSATLGEPIEAYMVQLEDLRAYRPNTHPDRLLKRLDKAIYPVLVGNQVLSSITLEKSDNAWKATNFGMPTFARLLTQTRRAAADRAGMPEKELFSVQVPALSAQFVGYHKNGKLMLVSLIDDRALKLSADRALPAEEVFASLVQPARAYNGLPL